MFNIERLWHSLTTLRDLGLNESETKVYLYLLEHGVSNPPEISRGTAISRSNLHHVLLGLSAKGLSKKQKRGKRFVYVASDPSATLRMLDERRKKMETVVEELTVLYKKQKNKPVIKFYEGVRELEQVFDDALDNQGKELLGFASTNRLFETMPDYNWSRWQKELCARGIFLRDILSCASKDIAEATHESARPYQEYKLIDEKYDDTPTDILVWDNKVAVMTLSEPVFGTVIENQDLVDTYRIQFDIIWRSLPRPKSIS